MNNNQDKNSDLLAYCGLYCRNCRTFINGKCPGCMKNSKASWCKIRTCCIDNKYSTCAECKTSNPRECKFYNNFISKAFSVLFRSDRPASIEYIKAKGSEAYISLMIDQNRQVIKK